MTKEGCTPRLRCFIIITHLLVGGGFAIAHNRINILPFFTRPRLFAGRSGLSQIRQKKMAPICVNQRNLRIKSSRTYHQYFGEGVVRFMLYFHPFTLCFPPHRPLAAMAAPGTDFSPPACPASASHPSTQHYHRWW